MLIPGPQSEQPGTALGAVFGNEHIVDIIGVEEAAVADADGFEIVLQYALEPVEGEVSESNRVMLAECTFCAGSAVQSGLMSEQAWGLFLLLPSPSASINSWR